MPRPEPYPRKRRLLMQVVLWLLLAASLGLAAWVARWRQTNSPLLNLPDDLPLQRT